MFLCTKVDKDKDKKGKFVPAYAVKAYTECSVIAAFILNLGFRGR
jgi:hypothetical protein